MELKEILTIFKEKGLRATPQRLSVYKFLCENENHPDVDLIYDNVLKENPSFSKTTVYNALKSLSENNLIVPILIDSTRIRFDAKINLHGHFKCDKCSNIFDFEIKSTEFSGLNGFKIKQKDVYFNGLCKDCQKILQ